MLERLPWFRKPLPILGHFLRRQVLVGIAVTLVSAFGIQQLFRISIDHALDQRVLELGSMIDSAAAISRAPEHLQLAVRELAKASQVKEIVIVSAKTGAVLAASRAPDVPLDADGSTPGERLARAALASGHFTLLTETPSGDRYSVMPLSLAAFLLSGEDILATSMWSLPRWYHNMRKDLGSGPASILQFIMHSLHSHAEHFMLAPGAYSGVVVINSGDDMIIAMMRTGSALVAVILMLVVAVLMASTAWFFGFAVHRPLESFTRVIARMQESDAAVRQPMHGIREFDAVATQWNDLVDAQERTKAALTSSESQHRRLIDNLPGYVYSCDNDKDWTLRYVSASVEEMFGLKREDIVDNRVISFGDLVHPDDRERVWIAEQEGVATHQPCEIRYRVITPSGTEMWLWDRAQGVYDDDGNLICLEGYAEDITALKKHTEDLLERDKVLNEQNERFNAALANMSQGLCMFDGEQRLVVCNERYASMYDLSPEQVKPGTLFRQILEHRIASGVYTGDDPEEYIQGLCAAVTEVKASTLIQELSDGRSIAILYQPLAGGGWLATHEDITALQKHTEDLLERDKVLNQQNERFNAALANMSQGLCMFDGEQRLVVCNERYASIYGLTPEQVKPGILLRQILELRIANGIYAGNDPEEYIQERCTAGVESKASTIIQELSDGRFIAIAQRPLAGGGWLATHEDITALKQNERDLDAARLKAEAANRAKSAFIANTNHEMRTPLNAIVGFSEMIAAERLGPLGNPEYREFAGLIESSGRSLLAIISTIMELSRLQSGDAGLDVEEIEPGETVARIVRLWNTRAHARGIAIALRNCARGVRLAADERLLCKIVDNLLSNAVKFSTEGGKVRVSLRLDAQRRFVLAIADDGIGIAREHLGDLTQPFFQVDRSLGRDTSGIGLGLTIVRECASLHNASLDITSKPGKGTRAAVTFPAAATVRDRICLPQPLPRRPRRRACAGRALQA